MRGPSFQTPNVLRVEGQRGLQHSQIVDCLAYEGMVPPLDGLGDLCGVVEDADDLPRCLPLDGLRGSVAHRAVAQVLREVPLERFVEPDLA